MLTIALVLIASATTALAGDLVICPKYGSPLLIGSEVLISPYVAYSDIPRLDYRFDTALVRDSDLHIYNGKKWHATASFANRMEAEAALAQLFECVGKAKARVDTTIYIERVLLERRKFSAVHAANNTLVLTRESHSPTNDVELEFETAEEAKGVLHALFKGVPQLKTYIEDDEVA